MDRVKERFTIDYSNEYACGVGFFDNGKRMPMDKVCDKLNTYDGRLEDKDDLLRKQLAISQNLDKQLRVKEKEIIDIKTTIKQMMDNERTKLGYNALKQAYEAIQ